VAFFNFGDMTVEEKQTFITHMEELRRAIIISVTAIVIGACVAFYYNEAILAVIVSPLSSLQETLIVTSVTEAFFVKIKLALYAGFVLAFPIVVWALWRFIKPGLYPHERKYVYILLPVTVLLFAGGVLFAYFGILPLVLNFFIYIAGENLETLFKIDQYVSFVTAFTIPFGLVFELPVLVFFLTKIGVIKPDWMAKNRKYALLAIVVIAAALTPGPDPISQLMMAVPVYFLYEVSIWVSRWAAKGRTRQSEIGGDDGQAT
jgi:sec-independent protein translocase protein TatC